MAMDPWAIKNVLGKNITTCGFNRKVSVRGGWGLEGRGAGRKEGAWELVGMDRWVSKNVLGNCGFNSRVYAGLDLEM